jgi:hypothetical protein
MLFPNVPLVLMAPFPGVQPARRSSLHEELRRMEADIAIVALNCST